MTENTFRDFRTRSTNCFCKGLDSVTTTCHCSHKTVIDNMKKNRGGCVSIELYLQKQVVGCIWPTGHSFPTPILVC